MSHHHFHRTMAIETQIGTSNSAATRWTELKRHPGKSRRMKKPSPKVPDEALGSTRERILLVATRFFAEQGFAGTSMPVIAKASGVTAGAIYRHFDSKADLLFEVTRRAIASIPLFVQAAERKNDATALATLAAAYTQPELKLLRQLSIEVHSAATRDAKVKRVLSISDERAIKGLGEIIVSGQRAGEIDSKLNPEFAACAFSIFIMGLTHMDTLFPRLIGDNSWRNFIANRVAALIGLI
jgi:TetR/AcrR family transcriptional regulator, transcriptional repressor of aconitase